MPDDQIDLSDIPEVTDWRGAVRGRYYQPPQKRLAIWVDADVLAWVKKGGRGYKVRINRILREAMIKERGWGSRAVHPVADHGQFRPAVKAVERIPSSQGPLWIRNFQFPANAPRQHVADFSMARHRCLLVVCGVYEKRVLCPFAGQVATMRIQVSQELPPLHS